NEHGLLEEARESWDYRISDELVYLVEPIGRNRKITLDIAKCYLQRRLWIEVHILLKRKWNRYYIAIAKLANEASKTARELRKVDIHPHPPNGNASIFVDIRQLVQLPQKSILIRCPIVVRLKTFDNCDSPIGHVFKGSFNRSRRAFVVPLAADRKLRDLR